MSRSRSTFSSPSSTSWAVIVAVIVLDDAATVIGAILAASHSAVFRRIPMAEGKGRQRNRNRNAEPVSVPGGSLVGMSESTPRYWVNTVSLDHVLQGVEGGFTQADHGRETRLRRLSRGDGLVFYSPRTQLGDGKPLQQFTGLGVVTDDEPFRVEQRVDFHPWRRRVAFEQVRPVPIRPLLPLLGFIGDEQRWGLPFRRGLFEVPAGDFGVIAGALRDAALLPDEFSTSGRTAHG